MKSALRQSRQPRKSGADSHKSPALATELRMSLLPAYHPGKARSFH